MAIVFSLPRTEENSNLQQPTKGGVWAPLPSLKAVASALYVESDSIDLHVLKSVPHAWGHVHIFETALTDGKHPGHSDAVRQWRALLAMLALRCEDGFALSVRERDLGAGGQAFIEVVREESAGHAHGRGGAWASAHLIYAGDAKVLVGMLSPRTIVVPARDYSGSHEVGHAWARDGLRDPVQSADCMTAHQLLMCRRFVASLEETVKTCAGDLGKDLTASLAGLLAKFGVDLDVISAGDVLAAPVQVPGRELVSGSDLPALYDAVNRVWRLSPDYTGRFESDATVALNRKPDGPFKRVVLADAALATTFHKAPTRVYLLGSYMLSDFVRDGNSFDRVRTEAAEQGILLLRPEELLAEDLTLVRGLKAANHPEEFASVLLPVTPLALLLWPVVDLKTRLGIVKRDGGWEVTLRIEVEDRKGNRLTHKIIRQYASPNEVDAPLALAAWPDFRSASWRWNYLYGSSFNPAPHIRRPSIVLTTGVSGEILARDLMSLADAGPVEQWQRLQKWASGEGPWGTSHYGGAPSPRADSKWFETLQTHVPPAEQAADTGTGSGPGDGSGHTKRLQRCDLPFEAVLFSTKPDTRYAGLGILPPLRAQRRSDVTADIAIDFGTTNTIVYSRVGGGSAKPVTFKPRLRRFNESEGDDEYMQFMPTEKVKQPFPTVMKEREFEGVNSANADLGQEPMWRDFALFDASVLRMTETILSDSYQGRVIVGFKWAMDAGSRQRVVRYLSHIVLMSLAEVAEVTPLMNMELRVSYPMSMPEGGRAYENLVTNDVTKRVGVGVRFYTESGATLNHFREQYLTQTTATLVLDIGGGSTDIALAAGDTRIWEHSVRLAGEDLMDSFLLYNREFLKDLELDGLGEDSGVFGDRFSQEKFMHVGRERVARPTGEEQDAAKTIINSELFGKRFEAQLTYRENEPRVKCLKSGAWLMVGGLFHFLDLQIRALMSKGLDARDLETVRVCFAGRGSTLLKLLSGEKAFDELMVLPSVAEAPVEGRAGKNRVGAVFSEHPKHEAARGMMVGEDLQQRFELTVERVSGVGATIGKIQIAPETILDSNLIAAVSKERSSIEMDDFQTFLKRTGDRCGFSIELGSEASTDIRRSGEAELDKFIRGRPVDPPFIGMLRRTLRLLYHGDGVQVSWSETEPTGSGGWLWGAGTTSSSATTSASGLKPRMPARKRWLDGFLRR